MLYRLIEAHNASASVSDAEDLLPFPTSTSQVASVTETDTEDLRHQRHKVTLMPFPVPWASRPKSSHPGPSTTVQEYMGLVRFLVQDYLRRFKRLLHKGSGALISCYVRN